ncbi:tyrosine-type recombinase/integrase [Autumnicola musiva]|uniref:Tyrosine-type recombinase/integrase n=1 Tax=Autumnicola musiva TaxID=3075589 RepID=A0ABU3D0R3_9FLAO|nr:tyrosine-type recombinase/integrase [Zunongwangia sp. F117]MDT0675127.1 tyrosine-type recombinase/integrase [Zunongwangia sp. F117]
MSTTVKITGKEDPKNRRYIYLNVRTTTNRKSRLKSLGIKVLKTHWSKDKQQVLSANANYKKFNEKINSILGQLNENYNSIEVLNVGNTIILDYWEKYIPTIENPSTKAAYRTAFNNFRLFLVNTKQPALKLAFLTPEIVKAYQTFLTTKGIGNLSGKIYLSFLKAIVNKAVKYQIVQYRVHPFIDTQTKPTCRKQSKSLNISQVNQISSIELPSKQNYGRKMFLFQLYGGGMRVGDLLLLKWENILVKEHGIYLSYFQNKTKKNVNSKLSYKAIHFLSIAFPIDIRHKIDLYLSNIEGYVLQLDNHEKTELDQLQLANKLKASQAQLNELIKVYLYQLTANELTTTVFDFAKDIEVQPNGYMSTAAKNKLISANQRLNYNLKEIAKKLKIPKFTSHAARHTYSQLLVDMGANVHHLSMLLGHSSIAITQNYISSLHNAKLDSYNDQLADL